MSDDEKHRILQAWEKVAKGAGERKKSMEKRAKRFLDGDVDALDEESG